MAAASVPRRRAVAMLGWWLAALGALVVAWLLSPYLQYVLIVAPVCIYVVLIFWAHHLTQEEGRVLRGADLAVTAIETCADVPGDVPVSPHGPLPCPPGYRDYLVDLTITPAAAFAQRTWIPTHIRLLPRFRSGAVNLILHFLNWTPTVAALRGIDIRRGDGWTCAWQNAGDAAGYDEKPGEHQGPLRLRLHLRSRPGRIRQLVYESEVLGDIRLPADPG